MRGNSCFEVGHNARGTRGGHLMRHLLDDKGKRGRKYARPRTSRIWSANGLRIPPSTRSSRSSGRLTRKNGVARRADEADQPINSTTPALRPPIAAATPRSRVASTPS